MRPPPPAHAPPAPPAHLGDAGSALWERLAAAYELDVGDCEVLRLACEALDRAAGLRARIAEAGVVMVDRHGVPRAHPAIRDEIAALALAARLLARLGLGVSA
jgi:P27 family predicted phage terminase small subunit